MVVPSPIWPLPLLPQQATAPAASSAHVCPFPTAMLVAVKVPWTSTGIALSVVVPSPSPPPQFMPQHITLPSARMAHEWSNPTPIVVAVVMPETMTGVVRLLLVVPSPRRPSPAQPQHITLPLRSRAQE